jgi:hypothetical protein
MTRALARPRDEQRAKAQRKKRLSEAGGAAKAVNASSPEVSTRQTRAARALLGWSQHVLSAAAGVSSVTVRRLEAVEGLFGGSANTRAKLFDAFSRAGVIFIGEDDLGIGVRLRSEPSAALDIAEPMGPRNIGNPPFKA